VATTGGKRRERREISYKLYDIYDLDFSCLLGSKLLRIGKQPCLKKILKMNEAARLVVCFIRDISAEQSLYGSYFFRF